MLAFENEHIVFQQKEVQTEIYFLGEERKMLKKTQTTKQFDT